MLKEAGQISQTANSPGFTVNFLEKTLRKGKNIIFNIFQKRIKPRNSSNDESNEKLLSVIIHRWTHSFIGKHLTPLTLAAYFVIPVVRI